MRRGGGVFGQALQDDSKSIKEEKRMVVAVKEDDSKSSDGMGKR